MQDHNPSHNIPAFDKGDLLLTNQLLRIWFNPYSQDFSDQLIQVVQKTDGPRLLNFSSFLRFRQQGNGAIVDSTYIQVPCMEIMEQSDNIIFDDVPTHLVKFSRNVARARCFVFSILNRASFISFSVKSPHKI